MDEKFNHILCCVVISVAIALAVNIIFTRQDREEAYSRGVYAAREECYEEFYSEGYNDGLDDGWYQGYMACLENNNIIE